MPFNYKKIVFPLLLLFLLFLPVEIFSRIYWAYWEKTANLSFLMPEKTYIFYPEMRLIDKQKTAQQNKYIDILFLGASVMNSIAREESTCRILQGIVGPQTGKTVRVFNACGSGHTTLDNRYKYEYLKDKKFDLVVYYDAINEVRANNCPPEMFKNNYSHYSWYRKVNFLEKYTGFKLITFPYTIYALAVDLLENKQVIKFVPKNIPRSEWTRYGSDIKTSLPYRENLSRIVTVANAKQERVLLIKFATHVPPDYTESRFLQKKLDYDYSKKVMMPIEIWGEVPNVKKGIQVHNAILEELAVKEKTYYQDANSFLPKNGKIFTDICHLSDSGRELFAVSVGNYIVENVISKKL